MPTIRIDDEVYAWLQKQACPFEDTPNMVLRRVAGLDEPSRTCKASTEESKMTHTQAQPAASRRPAMMNGRQLNKEWDVGARHALFHRGGTWYNNLERFPGALFDPHGYVLFRTEDEYRRNPKVRVTQETNVPDGISSLSGYIRMSGKHS